MICKTNQLTSKVFMAQAKVSFKFVQKKSCPTEICHLIFFSTSLFHCSHLKHRSAPPAESHQRLMLQLQRLDLIHINTYTYKGSCFAMCYYVSRCQSREGKKIIKQKICHLIFCPMSLFPVHSLCKVVARGQCQVQVMGPLLVCQIPFFFTGF